MKEFENLDELTHEDLLQAARSLRAQNEVMESERSVVGESLIKAQKLGEVIKDKAEQQAKEMLLTAEQERQGMLAGVSDEKSSLEAEVEKLRQIRGKIVTDITRIVEKYRLLVEQEQSSIESMVAAETRAMLEKPAPKIVSSPSPQDVGLEELLRMEVSAVAKEEPPVEITPTPAPVLESTPEPVAEISPEFAPPAPEVQLADLISASAMPPASPAVAPAAGDSVDSMNAFLASLKETAPSSDSSDLMDLTSVIPDSAVVDAAVEAAPQVGLQDMLSSVPVAEVPAPSTIADILGGMDIAATDAPTVSSESGTPIVNIEDLLK
jgi:hypothetical protein